MAAPSDFLGMRGNWGWREEKYLNLSRAYSLPNMLTVTMSVQIVSFKVFHDR
jgi:hypothetical protein